jgi:hypothetical protein
VWSVENRQGRRGVMRFRHDRALNGTEEKGKAGDVGRGSRCEVKRDRVGIGMARKAGVDRWHKVDPGGIRYAVIWPGATRQGRRCAVG